MGHRKETSKRSRAKTILRLPDLEQSKNAVLNSLAAASSQESYGHAIDEFMVWYCSEPRLAFDLTGDFCTSQSERESLRRRVVMSIKRYKPEQIVTLLRQIEVGIANGKTTPQACKEAEITIQTFYRWRKEYGGLKLDQAKRLKELSERTGS